MLKWDNLKILTGSKFAQHIILVPIIGWLLIYQNTFSKIISDIFGLDIEISLGWELLIFYLGLILIGFSAMVFRIFVPIEIINHDGLQGYVEDSEKFITRKQFANICETLGMEVPQEISVPTMGTGNVLDETRDQWLRLNIENIRDVLCKFYQKENSKGPFWRSLSSITFAVGAICSLIPTIVTVNWAFGQIFTMIK